MPDNDEPVTATEIINRNLARLGEAPQRPATIAVDPGAATTLDISMLERAREMMQAVPDMVDYDNHAADAMRYAMEAHPPRRNRVETSIHDRGDYTGAVELRSRVNINGEDLSYASTVHRQELALHEHQDRTMEIVRRTAREHAMEYAHWLEQEITQSMMRLIAEQRRERYGGRRQGRDYLNHGYDIMRGAVSGPKKGKPDEAEKIDWLHIYPKKIEMGKFTAHLLDDTMKIYHEGTDMRHCLYRSYTRDIQNGKYIVYHLDVPKKMCKSGLTLSYERTKATTNLAPGSTNWVAWKFHQCKGKANSTRQSDELNAFYEYIEHAINNCSKENVRG